MGIRTNLHAQVGMSRPSIMRLRSRLRFAVSVGATLVALMLVFAACTAATPTPTVSLEGVEIVDSPGSNSEMAGETEVPIGDRARGGGTLRIEVQDCNIPDPAIDIASTHLGLGSMPLVHEMHVGLMKHSDEDPFGAAPELAESFEVRENGKLFEFTLRKDLKFSDGSPLIAADVLWSWERALRKSTPNSRANDVFGDVIGAEVVASGLSRELTGVTVVDDRHLEVRLTSPRPDFPLLLADPVASVISRSGEDEWGAAWFNDPEFPADAFHLPRVYPETLPIGAGPFAISNYAFPSLTLQGRSGESRCGLVRNDHYWGRPAHLDGVIGAIHTEEWDFATAYARHRELLGSGQLDLVSVVTELIDPSEIPPNLVLVSTFWRPFSDFVTLNPSVPPLNDVHFRKALSYAVGLAKSDDASNAVTAVGFLSHERRLIPGSLYANGSDLTANAPDAELAKAELDRSGYSAAGRTRQIRILRGSRAISTRNPCLFLVPTGLGRAVRRPVGRGPRAGGRVHTDRTVRGDQLRRSASDTCNRGVDLPIPPNCATGDT